MDSGLGGNGALDGGEGVFEFFGGGGGLHGSEPPAVEDAGEPRETMEVRPVVGGAEEEKDRGSLPVVGAEIDRCRGAQEAQELAFDRRWHGAPRMADRHASGQGGAVDRLALDQG